MGKGEGEIGEENAGNGWRALWQFGPRWEGCGPAWTAVVHPRGEAVLRFAHSTQLAKPY